MICCTALRNSLKTSTTRSTCPLVYNCRRVSPIEVAWPKFSALNRPVTFSTTGVGRRLKKSWPLRPTQKSSGSTPAGSSRMACWARRITLELNPPHNPRSAVTTTNSTRRTSRSSSSGWEKSDTEAAVVPSTSCSRMAYGRASWMASVAFRIFAAATIFMALVICWVDFTLPMRRLICFRLAMAYPA
jgi:hypothetical protein